MKTAPISLSRLAWRTSLALTIFTATFGQTSRSDAAVQTWDAISGTAGAQDGAGTWASGLPNWRDTGSSTDNQNFANGDAVTFGAGSGAAGNVTINGTVTTNSLTFAAPGSGSYTLSNGASTPNLNLSSGSIITVNNSVAPTISATITGSNGFTKTGTGTLILSGANTGLSGGTTLSQGTLALGTTTAAGTGAITLGDANMGLNNIQLTLGAANIANSVFVANQGSGTVTLFGAAQFQSQTGSTILNRDLTLAITDAGGADWWYAFGAISGTGNVTWKAGAAANQTRIIAGSTNTYSGTNTVSQGRIQVQNTSAFGQIINDMTLQGTGQLNLRTNINIGGLNGAGSGIYSSTGTQIINLGNGDKNGSFSGLIFESGGVTAVTKFGTGIQALSGANSYTGTTTINGGTLLANTLVSGTNSATGTGVVIVGVSGTLGGTGQIRPTGTNGITVNGILAPGASIGTLTIDSGGSTLASILTMASGSSLGFELGAAGLTLGSVGSSDLLVINGSGIGDVMFNNNTVNFLSTGAVGFYKLFDTSLADATLAGDTWAGLTYDTTTGVVSSGLTASNLIGVGTFIVGTASNGGALGDIYLSVAAVPEPTTWAALVVGGAGLCLLRRKRS